MIQFDNAIKFCNEYILNSFKEAGIKAWIAGGFLRDYFMGVPIKTDCDIFFPNQEEFEKAENFFKNNECNSVYEGENDLKVRYKNKVFDLIKIYFSSPQETINAFDFTVSMLAVDGEKVYHGETTFIDLAKRQLMINRITYPISSLYRAFKYYKKGFLMCKGEMLKLAEAIQDMPKINAETEDNTVINGAISNNDDKNLNLFKGID